MTFKYFIFQFFLLIILANHTQAGEGYNFSDQWSIDEIELEGLIADVSLWHIDFADSLNGMIGAGYPNDSNPALVRTTDGGVSWEMVFHYRSDTTLPTTTHSGDTSSVVVKSQKLLGMVYPDTNICLGLTHDNWSATQYDYIIRSTDKGENWSIVLLPEHHSYTKLVMRNKDTGAVAGAFGNICLTYDGGLTWQEFEVQDTAVTKYLFYDFAWPEENTFIALGVDMSYPDHMFHILRTDDFGATWNDYHIDYDFAEYTWCFTFPDANNGWCGFEKLVEGKTYRNIIAHTSDGGKTWAQQLDTVGHQTSIYSNMDIEFFDKNHGVSVGYTSDIYLTTDGGKNWIEQSPWYEGKVNFVSATSACFIKPNLIFVCDVWGKEVCRYEGDPVGVKEEKNIYFSDLGIFPNPAKRGHPINIKFQIERPGRLEFQIYDCLGNEMDAPYGIYSAAGAVTVSYTPDRDFPPGVYFMRIVSEDGVLSKEFVVSE